MSTWRLAASLLIVGLPAASACRADEPSGPALAILEAHNETRARKGVPNLEWSAALAESAGQSAAELARDPACVAYHSAAGHGENLYQCTGACKPNEKWLRKAVESWSGEGAWYDNETLRCAAPEGESCGHYTQVVWCSTAAVGCGWSTCGKSVIVVCQYDPPGNWRGRSPFDCPAAASMGEQRPEQE